MYEKLENSKCENIGNVKTFRKKQKLETLENEKVKQLKSQKI